MSDNYLEKIDKQISDIEQRINNLLENVNEEELTSAECMDFAIKLQGQLAKFLALRRNSEIAHTNSREKEFIGNFYEQIARRGRRRRGSYAYNWSHKRCKCKEQKTIYKLHN